MDWRLATTVWWFGDWWRRRGGLEWQRWWILSLSLTLILSLSNWMWVLFLLWILIVGIDARFMVATVGNCYVVGGDGFTVDLGRLLLMWVAIWWQWVCGCFDSLSQIRCKLWFCFEFLLWVSVHLQVHGGGSGGFLCRFNFVLFY